MAASSAPWSSASRLKTRSWSQVHWNKKIVKGSSFVSIDHSAANKPVPQHIAIIMDGNRRWAKQSGLPVALGHASGARQVRSIVQACADRGVPFLTLFAFSTENWQRPKDEVSSLMSLMTLYLQKEVKEMSAKGVRLKVVGDTFRRTPLALISLTSFCK